MFAPYLILGQMQVTYESSNAVEKNLRQEHMLYHGNGQCPEIIFSNIDVFFVLVWNNDRIKTQVYPLVSESGSATLVSESGSPLAGKQEHPPPPNTHTHTHTPSYLARGRSSSGR